MKLTREQIEERTLVLHKRKPTDMRCPTCGRDCGSASGLRRHRNVCKPWVDQDYRDQWT